MNQWRRGQGTTSKNPHVKFKFRVYFIQPKRNVCNSIFDKMCEVHQLHFIKNAWTLQISKQCLQNQPSWWFKTKKDPLFSTYWCDFCQKKTKQISQTIILPILNENNHRISKFQILIFTLFLLPLDHFTSHSQNGLTFVVHILSCL